jgi:hypothetical protein
LSWANARDSNTMRELMKDAYYERAAALRAGRDADAPPLAITGAQRVASAPVCAALTLTPAVEDASEAVRMFVERRPPPPFCAALPLQDPGREQSDSACAQPANTRAEEDEHEASASEARQPAVCGDGGREGEDETSFADIDAVFGKQIREMKDLKLDANDPHLASVLAEIQRLERERLELIRMEKERLKRVAEERAARDEAEKKRLRDLATRLQQEKERRLQEERDRQQLQEKLRRIGRCSMGYAWIRTSYGYECEGGSHSVSDHQL